MSRLKAPQEEEEDEEEEEEEEEEDEEEDEEGKEEEEEEEEEKGKGKEDGKGNRIHRNSPHEGDVDAQAAVDAAAVEAQEDAVVDGRPLRVARGAVRAELHERGRRAGDGGRSTVSRSRPVERK